MQASLKEARGEEEKTMDSHNLKKILVHTLATYYKVMCFDMISLCNGSLWEEEEVGTWRHFAPLHSHF